jgi:protein Mpv17
MVTSRRLLQAALRSRTDAMRARALLARGLCVSSAASFAFESYQALLVEHPLATNIGTAGALAAAGDAVAQRRGVYDAKRGLSFVAFDAAYRGGFQTPLLPWIIEHCHGDVLGQLVPFDANVLAAAECTLFNQLTVIPLVYYPLFFGITGYVQNLDGDASLARAKAQFGTLCVRNWKFWIPANFLQFCLLPGEWQVPYTCAMGFAWNIILSASAGDASTVEEAPEAR